MPAGIGADQLAETFLRLFALETPMPARRRSHHRRGAAAVELAFVLFLLVVPVLLGLWEVGRLAHVEQQLSNAAREGARRAATGQQTDANVHQVVIDYLRAAGVPTANARVTIDNLTSGQQVTYDAGGSIVSGSGLGLTTTPQMDQLRVTVTIPFADVRWIALNRLTSGDTLDGQAVWNSLKDKDFPSLSDPGIE